MLESTGSIIDNRIVQYGVANHVNVGSNLEIGEHSRNVKKSCHKRLGTRGHKPKQFPLRFHNPDNNSGM